jgi:hypothetical protein
MSSASTTITITVATTIIAATTTTATAAKASAKERKRIANGRQVRRGSRGTLCFASITGLRAAAILPHPRHAGRDTLSRLARDHEDNAGETRAQQAYLTSSLPMWIIVAISSNLLTLTDPLLRVALCSVSALTASGWPSSMCNARR